MKVNFDLGEVLNYIEEQQVKTVTGIPLGFNRYKEAFDSIERDDNILLVGGSGAGKFGLQAPRGR